MRNILGIMKTFWCNGYAYCFTRLFLKTDDIKTLTKYVIEGWYMGLIDFDGLVLKPLTFIRLLNGHQYKDIKNVEIKSLTELPEGEFIVEYKKTPTSKESHFVIANKDGVVWDPYGSSIIVQTGAPFSYVEFVDY